MDKYTAVGSDFNNQRKLIEKNFGERISELKDQQKEREERRDKLNEDIDNMINEHKKAIHKKTEVLTKIKNNTEEFSKFFSEQLGDIQKNLQGQIDQISKNWEINFSEHLKRYEEGIRKYDIGNNLTSN